MLPVFLLVSVVVSRVMARHITKPILMMKDAMQKIKEGDFRQNITVHASTEIEEVVDAFNDMAIQLDALVANIKEKQETLRIVELQNLKAQIKPHFLYNILDLIRWKAKLGEIDDVEKIIINLAKIMRASIDSQDDIVMVSQELDLVRRYCGLQQYLHRDLTVGFDIHPDVLSCRIPKLILQPIVENAIVHGVGHRSSGGVIHITARREGDMLTFTVEDNGEGFTPPAPDPSPHGGIGLTNVNRRVKLYGGAQCGLAVLRGTSGGATVLIRIRAIDQEEGAL